MILLLPPPQLRSLFPGPSEIKEFLFSGQCAKNSVQQVAIAQKLEVNSILEFGCGAGSILRHWQDKQKNISGSEASPEAIQWLRQNMKNVHLSPVQYSRAELPYNNEQFNLIYAPYVFGCLNWRDQEAWLGELSRTLKHGGILIVFLRSSAEVLTNLSGDEKKRYLEGELIVVNGGMSGSKDCRACHPKEFIYSQFSKHLPVVNYIPSARYTDGNSSIMVNTMVVMRKIG